MKLSTRAWLVVAVVLPCIVVAWVNGWFVWNHFVEGAYIHDSGWYSYIVWHNGLLPKNTSAAEGLPDYYGIHFSPLVSAASVLSYLVPLDRVRWYCLFQLSIYTPLPIAATLLINERRLVNALAVGAAAIVFALSGQVIQCIGFPHFEIFVVVGIAFMLVGFATGRMKLAWAGLLMAAVTREDGGFHAAFFCAAVVASDIFGRPFPVRRKAVIVVFVVATLASVLAFVLQKAFFQTAGLFRREYLGDPAYVHVTAAEMWRRALLFFERCGFIALPLLGTFVIAWTRRDARYLLGWAVEVPWLLLNFFAHQELKATFTIYTGFPFVASYFWVGVYGLVARRDAKESALSPIAALATVSLLSTCGVGFSNPTALIAFVRMGRGPVATPSRPIEAFIERLRRDPNVYGRVVVDPAVASWSLESITRRQHFIHTFEIPDFEARDAAIFYADGSWRDRLPWFLARSPFETCGHMLSTPLFVCTRKGRPFPEGFVEDSPITKSLYVGESSTYVHDGFNIAPHPKGTLAVHGPYATLPKGSYTVTWHLRWGVCIDSNNALAGIDTVSHRGQLTGHRFQEPQPTLEQTFTLTEETTGIEFRAWAGRCAYAIDRVDFRSSQLLPKESWP